MFDLEEHIKDWRREMFLAGIERPEVLDELEGHLRDDLERQMRSGITPQQAFESAAQHVGHAGVLKKEFKKVGSLMNAPARARRHLLTLAGIPGHYLDTTMNATNLNIEPRWATYLRSSAILAPAAIILFLVSVFAMPQLQLLCQKSNFYQLQHLAAWFLQLYQFNVALVSYAKDHLFILLPAVAITLGVLEWRSSKWPRYRRAVLGTGAFLLNVAVLLFMFQIFLVATFVATVLVNYPR